MLSVIPPRVKHPGERRFSSSCPNRLVVRPTTLPGPRLFARSEATLPRGRFPDTALYGRLDGVTEGRMGDLRLADLGPLAEECRESGVGFSGFKRDGRVKILGWPDDVTEQWLYDHGNNVQFLRDYGRVRLDTIAWEVETVSSADLVRMPTGPSDGDVISRNASFHEHLVETRRFGVHIGVRETWELHGTWIRWPILIDRTLVDPVAVGLQIVEGRTRVGVLAGRLRAGLYTAESHLAWVGRPKS